MRNILVIIAFFFCTQIQAQLKPSLEPNYTIYWGAEISRLGLDLNIIVKQKFGTFVGVQYTHYVPDLYNNVYYNYVGVKIGMRYALFQNEKNKLWAVLGWNFNFIHNYSKNELEKLFGKKYNIPSLSPEWIIALKYEYHFSEHWYAGVVPSLFPIFSDSNQNKLNYGLSVSFGYNF